MLKIYHNPRCRKSREALQFIEEQQLEHKVVKYLENPLHKEELKEILNKIDLQPSAIVRKNEAEWKAIPNRKTMSEEEILDTLVTYPKLIERPIVVDANRGTLARPIDNLIHFLKQD